MKALEQLSYGTFVITVKKDGVRNGCILNTLIQIDESTLLVSLQNFSYTNSLLEEGDYVALHTIHNQASRKIFEVFGYQSGRNKDKFRDIDVTEDNSFLVLKSDVNNVFKGQVVNQAVLDTHTLYIIHILSSEVLNTIPSLTYKEYQEIIKPRFKTRRNLEEAFKNESMARNKYSYYASVAKKEGYANISELFLTIANNEKEHGEIWARQLKLIGEDTQTNLKDSIAAENKEWQEDYKRFEMEALEEGYMSIAKYFELIQTIEKEHAQAFQKVLDELEQETIFKDEKEVRWICRNCGYVYTGKEALMLCPMCNHPVGYMERK